MDGLNEQPNGIPYQEWLKRFKRLVELRKNGVSSAELDKVDRFIHRNWARCISDCANGAALPKVVPYSPIAEQAFQEQRVANPNQKRFRFDNTLTYIPNFKSFTKNKETWRGQSNWKSRFAEAVAVAKQNGNFRRALPQMTEYSKLAKAVASGHEFKVPVKSKRPSRYWMRKYGYMVAKRKQIKCFEDWLPRAEAMVALIEQGISSTRIAASDPPMYRGWISCLRSIAETGEWPREIPPKDANKCGERRSKITYEVWCRRITNLANAYNNGLRGADLRREDSFIYDFYKNVVYDVAAGAPIPRSRPECGTQKPHRFLSWVEWRDKINLFASMLSEDRPRIEMRDLDVAFWNKYKSLIHHVASGGLLPFEVHDEIADGCALEQENCCSGGNEL